MNSSQESPDREPGFRAFSLIRGGSDVGPHRSVEDHDAQDASAGTGDSPGSVDSQLSADSASEGHDTGHAVNQRGAVADQTDSAGSLDHAIVEHAKAVLADTDPASYYRVLKGLVRTGQSSLLGPLDYSPSLSFHDPTCVVVDAEPVTVETAELYARTACHEFDAVLVAALADPARGDLLDALYNMLFIERRNVAIVTNHGQIIDIALLLTAVHAAMLAPGRTFGVLGATTTIDELAHRSNVLVSRMVTTRQAFGIPAIQVLQTISRIFLSVPQTASRRRAKMDPSLVRANNTLMRIELTKQLEKGGQILAMAASGTQDLTIPRLMHRARSIWRQRRGDDPGEEPTLHLQPLYNGTISLMRTCDYVIPVAISLEPTSPACVVGSMTALSEDEDCHRVMDWIADAHQKATGVPTIYHWHEDDLLSQVRGLINR